MSLLTSVVSHAKLYNVIRVHYDTLHVEKQHSFGGHA